MKLLLISPEKPPVRLLRQGGNLRTAVGPTDMFKPHVGAFALSDIDCARVIAPYNRPVRVVPFVLLAFALGLLLTALPYPTASVMLFSAVPIALAIVSFIVPAFGNSTWVIVTIKENGREHMIAVKREETGDLKRIVPQGVWLDDPPAMESQTLTEQERVRLKLMQVGMALLTVSFSAFAITALQSRNLGLGVGTLPKQAQDAITVMFIVVEIGAFVLFAAGWVRMIRLMKGK